MARILSARQALRCALLLTLGSGISTAADPEKPQFTVHADADEIRLTFTAVDQNDRAVTSLHSNDVVVIDRDFVVRTFESFTRSESTQLQVAILADTSESVAPEFRHEICDILAMIAAADSIPDQSLSIFSFRNSEPALVCAGNCRTSQAAEHLPAMRPRGFTPLFDTVIAASRFLARSSDYRAQKILIVLSDGTDNISRNTLNQAVETAVADEVQIFTVDLNPHADSASAVLRRLSTETGGRYFSANTLASQLLAALLENSRATYFVSYRVPSRILGFHSVRVLPAHNLRLQFRSRSGYYYPDMSR